VHHIQNKYFIFAVDIIIFRMAETKNILVLADNQPITRLGAMTLWNNTFPDSEIVLVNNKSELIQLLPRCPYAIILIDYGLFDMSGLDNLLIISMRFPHTRWIFFSDDLSETFLRRVVLERHFSVVMKDAPIEELAEAYRQAVQQSHYICEKVEILFKEQMKKDEREGLTSTEREILRSIAQGKTSQMIADERNLSIHTISTHRKNIFRKIHVNNVLEATKYAAKVGVIDRADYLI